MAASRTSMGGKVLAGILLILLATTHAEDDFEGSRTLQLEHSFDQGTNPLFTKRGFISILSLKNNKAQFSQVSPLLPEERVKLEKIARENNGIYRIRIPVVKGNSVTYVSTFTRSCSIYESGLRDHLMVNFDLTGEVLGVSIFPETGPCVGTVVSEANLTIWKTTVELVQSLAGPVPDTQTYIDKIKQDEQERVKGQPGDNRSFFGKYWMYIVPVVIMMIIMSSTDQGAAGR